MKNYIIGLNGFSQSGKDTVADLLVTHFHFKKLAFADALRAEISEGFGVDRIYLSHQSTKNVPSKALSMRRAPREFLAAVALTLEGIPREPNGHIKAEWLDEPRSPRQISQWWGTEYRRGQHKSYWTRIVTARVNDLQRDGHRRFVISDCRYDNEFETVANMGGRLWQVTRPGIDQATTVEGQHSSASSGVGFKPDAIIANNHDIRHLQHLVLSEFVAVETGLPSAKVTVIA